MKTAQDFSPEALKKLVNEEYLALLDGDLDEIERLGRKKASLLSRIGDLPIEAIEDYAMLRSELLRNQQLANSSVLGMQKAMSRMKSILEIRTELKTYDSSGAKTRRIMRAGQVLSKRS